MSLIGAQNGDGRSVSRWAPKPPEPKGDEIFLSSLRGGGPGAQASLEGLGAARAGRGGLATGAQVASAEEWG